MSCMKWNFMHENEKKMLIILHRRKFHAWISVQPNYPWTFLGRSKHTQGMIFIFLHGIACFHAMKNVHGYIFGQGEMFSFASSICGARSHIELATSLHILNDNFWISHITSTHLAWYFFLRPSESLTKSIIFLLSILTNQQDILDFTCKSLEWWFSEDRYSFWLGYQFFN